MASWWLGQFQFRDTKKDQHLEGLEFSTAAHRVPAQIDSRYVPLYRHGCQDRTTSWGLGRFHFTTTGGAQTELHTESGRFHCRARSSRTDLVTCRKKEGSTLEPGAQDWTTCRGLGRVHFRARGARLGPCDTGCHCWWQPWPVYSLCSLSPQMLPCLLNE